MNLYKRWMYKNRLPEGSSLMRAIDFYMLILKGLKFKRKDFNHLSSFHFKIRNWDLSGIKDKKKSFNESLLNGRVDLKRVKLGNHRTISMEEFLIDEDFSKKSIEEVYEFTSDTLKEIKETLIFLSDNNPYLYSEVIVYYNDYIKDILSLAAALIRTSLNLGKVNEYEKHHLQ